MTTYLVLKSIHRYTGLSLTLFILMYFITGFVMTHHRLFEGPKKETIEKRQNFRAPADLSLDEVAVLLQDSFSLRGYREKPRMRSDSTVDFGFYHPGTFQGANLNLREDLLVIKIQPQNMAQILNGFHRIHGYGGGGVYDLFVILMDLTSLSLLLFAASGVYLWLKVIRRKLLGWAILMASILYTAFVVGRFMI